MTSYIVATIPSAVMAPNIASLNEYRSTIWIYLHRQGFRLSTYPKRPYGCKILPYASQIRQTVSWSPPDRYRSSIQVRDTWKEILDEMACGSQFMTNWREMNRPRMPHAVHSTNTKVLKAVSFQVPKWQRKRGFPRTHGLSSLAILSIQRPICLVKQFEQAKQAIWSDLVSCVFPPFLLNGKLYVERSGFVPISQTQEPYLMHSHLWLDLPNGCSRFCYHWQVQRIYTSAPNTEFQISVTSHLTKERGVEYFHADLEEFGIEERHMKKAKE